MFQKICPKNCQNIFQKIFKKSVKKSFKKCVKNLPKNSKKSVLKTVKKSSKKSFKNGSKIFQEITKCLSKNYWARERAQRAKRPSILSVISATLTQSPPHRCCPILGNIFAQKFTQTQY